MAGAQRDPGLSAGKFLTAARQLDAVEPHRIEAAREALGRQPSPVSVL
jgi:hypothetical protein